MNDEYINVKREKAVLCMNEFVQNVYPDECFEFVVNVDPDGNPYDTTPPGEIDTVGLFRDGALVFLCHAWNTSPAKLLVRLARMLKHTIGKAGKNDRM